MLGATFPFSRNRTNESAAPAKKAPVVLDPILSFFSIGAAISAALASNVVAVYYVLGWFGIETENPVIVYAPLALFSIVFLRPDLRIVAFGALTAYLAATSLWSDSITYRDAKLEATLIAPPLFLIAGYGTAKATKWFAGALAMLAALSYLATSGELDTLVLQSDISFNYQRMGMLAGLAAVTLALQRNRLLLPVAAALAITSAFSGGRTGLLILAIGAILYVRLSLRKSVIIMAATAIFLTIAFDPIANAILDMNPPLSVQRAIIATIETGPSSAVYYWSRADFGSAAFWTFLDAPIFGVGWGGFPLHAGLLDLEGLYPHNLVLELLAESGAVGLLLFLAWVAPITYRFTRLPEFEEKRIIIGITLSGLAIAMFVGDWPFQTVLFYGLGMMIRAIATYDRTNTSNGAVTARPS